MSSDEAIVAAIALTASCEAAERSKARARDARRGRHIKPMTIREAVQRYGVPKGQIERTLKWLEGDVRP
jgi:hypothetical protein